MTDITASGHCSVHLRVEADLRISPDQKTSRHACCLSHAQLWQHLSPSLNLAEGRHTLHKAQQLRVINKAPHMCGSEPCGKAVNDVLLAYLQGSAIS